MCELFLEWSFELRRRMFASYICIYTHIYIYIYIYIYIFIYSRMGMYIYIYILSYGDVYIYIFIYIYICMFLGCLYLSLHGVVYVLVCKRLYFGCPRVWVLEK